MILEQNLETIIYDSFGGINTSCIMKSSSVFIDEDCKAVVKCGIYKDIESANAKFNPIQVLTWEFFIDKTYSSIIHLKDEGGNDLFDDDGNRIIDEENSILYAHGSPFVFSAMDVLKPIDNPMVLIPKSRAHQEWIYEQPCSNGKEIVKVEDLFHFPEGLLPNVDFRLTDLFELYDGLKTAYNASNIDELKTILDTQHANSD